MKHLMDKARIALRNCKVSGETITADSLKDRETVRSLIQEDCAYNFLSSLRGSPPFFQKLSKDLMIMIRTLEPVRFFVAFLQQKPNGHIYS